MTKSRVLGGVLALTAVAVVAGCGAEPGRTAAPGSPYPSINSSTPTNPAPSVSSPRTSPPATESGTPPTTTRPTEPPRDPTDQIKKTNIVVGTVTRGGSGPCYGLQTDDGTEYALYSGSGRQLIRGTRVRVRVKPSSLRINCGPGRFVEITAFEP